MQGNRGVVYIKPGLVEVHSIDFPKLALGARQCHHGVILKVLSTNICGSDQHMVRGRTTAPAGLVLGHEITGEVIESRSRRRVHRCRGYRFRAVQYRLRTMPHLQKRGHRYLPEYQRIPAGSCVRVRRYGRMGGRTSPVRDGAVRRFQPAQVPGSTASDGKDQGSDSALRHFSDRLSRRRQRRCRTGKHRLCCWSRTCGLGLRGGLPPAWRGRRDSRRHDSRAPRSGPKLRMRNGRSAFGRNGCRPDLADTQGASG